MALRAAQSALLVYVRAHDAEYQKQMGPDYTMSECMCNTCCESNEIYTIGGPPGYPMPALTGGASAAQPPPKDTE